MVFWARLRVTSGIRENTTTCSWWSLHCAQLIRLAVVLVTVASVFWLTTEQAHATITFKSEGSLDSTGDQQHVSTPVYPSGVTAGDLLILIIGMKPSSANSGSVTTPNGWIPITSITGAGGYGSTLGADTGNTNLFAYYRIADGTGRDTRLEITLSTDRISWATIQNLGGTLGGWDVAGVTGSDTSAGSVSVTFGSDPGVTTGDYIMGAFNIPTDVTTPTQFSAEALTQTGVTFGTVVETGEVDSATGTDIGGFLYRAPVSSGTSSDVPVLTATAGGTTTNVRGPAIFVRIREAVAPGIPTFYEDDGGSNQVAFKGARMNDTTPIVRVSAIHTGAFDQFELEFNTASDFSGTSYTETFAGSYSSATAYNLQTTGTLGLPTTNGVTYFVRARASADSGAHYGAWSTADIRSYTYISSGDATWYQTTDEQFNEWTTATSTRRTGSGSVQIANTPYVRGWTSGATADAATSITLDKPATTRSGDVLVILVGSDDTTNTDQWNNTTLKPSGFTMIAEVGDTGSDSHASAFYRVADGTEATTINVPSQSSDDVWGYYIRLVGVSTTTPLDVTGTTATIGAATSFTIPTVDTTVTNTLAIYTHSYDGGDGNPFGLSGTGWTKIDGINATGGTQADANGAGGSWGIKEVASIGATGDATVSSINDGFAGFQFALAPSNVTAGTIMSPEVDFDWVTGMSTWDTVSFSTTESSGDVKVRLYYTVSTACDTIVSDGVLSGNSSGFDVSASPIDISALSPAGSTYNKICVEATLIDSGGTPTLDEWSVSWAAGGGGGDPPTVATGFGSNVNPTTATVNGAIFATGGNDATQHGFAHGTDATLGTVIATSTLGSYSGVGEFSDAVSSLSTGVTYYFRAYATNVNGTGYGDIQEFVAGNAGVTRSLQLFEGATIKLQEGQLLLQQR